MGSRRTPRAAVLAAVPGLGAAVMVGAVTGCAPAPSDAVPARADLATAAVGAYEQAPAPVAARSPAGPSPSGPSPSPPATVGDRFACPQPTVTVLDSAELTRALAEAAPGDVIGLEKGVYTGRFRVSASGTPERPIYLCGERDAVLDGLDQSAGYVLHVDGASDWRFDGFSVRNGLKTVVLDGAHRVVLQDLKVYDSGDEAVHLRRGTTDSVVRDSVVRRAGRVHPEFGEGIYVGSARSNWCELTGCAPDRSDRNLILDNAVTMTTAENLDIKEGTSGGLVAGNRFDGTGMVAADSWVDVKGNGWRLIGNHGKVTLLDGFQVHVEAPGWGAGNVFDRNTLDLGGSAGAGIVVGAAAGNRVGCANEVVAVRGRYADVPCVHESP